MGKSKNPNQINKADKIFAYLKPNSLFIWNITAQSYTFAA